MTSLALLQLVSPALPVGAFSYSEGLEVLIQAGSIADEQASRLGWRLSCNGARCGWKLRH